MKTVTFETKIDCSVEALFDFHSDTRNLPKITPPDTSVEIVRLDPLAEGATAVLKIRKGVLGFTWHVRFEQVEPPSRIVDVATRSPFKTFRHEHLFLPLEEGGALLRDTVTYALPLEPLSNIARWFVEKDLEAMFDYRHKVTKSLLENGR
jgi:ligand-binding SRPBCC domain-containing protein